MGCRLCEISAGRWHIRATKMRTSGSRRLSATAYEDLKGRGYRRVILGGQSWGAWTTLVAERRGDLTADALFLMAPATHGGRTALVRPAQPVIPPATAASSPPWSNPSRSRPRPCSLPATTMIRVAATNCLKQQVRNRQLAHVLIAESTGPERPQCGLAAGFRLSLRQMPASLLRDAHIPALRAGPQTLRPTSARSVIATRSPTATQNESSAPSNWWDAPLSFIPPQAPPGK